MPNGPARGGGGVMLDTVFGEGQTGLKVFLFVIVVLALLALAFWLVRRFAGGRLGGGATRGRQPRLAVIDQATVDNRRRLLLLRRHNVEHLLIIGRPSGVGVRPHHLPSTTPGRGTTGGGGGAPAAGRGPVAGGGPSGGRRAGARAPQTGPKGRARRGGGAFPGARGLARGVRRWRPKNRWSGRESGRTSRRLRG